MSAVVTVRRAIGERTGGRTGAGYEDLLESWMTDVQSTPFVGKAWPLGVIPSRRPLMPTVDAVAETLLNVIEMFFLPEDPRRLKLYEALTESLLQQMANYQQSTATSGAAVEISPESEEERYYASYYEKHESPETINAFLRILRSMPVEHEEPTPVYSDQELEAFS
jgi:hypothetical protein